MRRCVSILVLAVTAAACGGADDASPDTTPPATAAEGDGTTDTAAAPSTVFTASEKCESEPDPADYIDGQFPPVNRPCEIPTELQTYTVRDGIGRPAQDGDTLILDYTGVRSEDGELFDTSYTRGVPLDFVIGRGGVIQGWDDGLIGAQAGSLIKLDIPTDLAYGDAPPGGAESPIRPGDALTFIAEIRAVIPAVTAADAPLDLQIEPSVGATEVTTQTLKEGDGAAVELGSTTVIHLLLVRGDNEVVLFNTWERMDPLQIIMEEGQTLPGVFEGLQGASVGSRLVITMPPADAFGDQGEASLGLPAGTDLIAVVDVVGVY